MERIVKFYPAFDKRNPDPSKNYGIHGVELKMVLKGSKGAVQFLLYTNWNLPHVAEELEIKILTKAKTGNSDDISLIHLLNPVPADLGYHSFIPLYEGQPVASDSCEYLEGEPCYYDGSSLNAKKIYKVLLNEGSDGVWRELENFYKDIFECEV